MIVSNAIRSAKTPTKQLLKELIDLLKHIAEQDNRNVVSTVALAVTRLIHKACIHETSSVMNFPARHMEDSVMRRLQRLPETSSPSSLRSCLPPERLTSTNSSLISMLSAILAMMELLSIYSRSLMMVPLIHIPAPWLSINSGGLLPGTLPSTDQSSSN